ncbi:MAG: HD domain-containing protein [Herpetosiphon sp.]
MQESRIQHIEQHVRNVMAQVVIPDLKIAHDFKHVDRVRHWAMQIAYDEGDLDLDMVEATALLHDIGLAYVEHRKQHASVGAERAARFLHEHQFFMEQEINAIAEAIRCHSSLTGGAKLGVVLRDADMLDLFGAVGLMRSFTSQYAKPEYNPQNIKSETWGITAAAVTQRFTTGIGIGPYIIDQINFQLSCYENVQTRKARELAQPLVAFMHDYVVQLEQEINTGRTSL